jgi:hypothetical protein
MIHKISKILSQEATLWSQMMDRILLRIGNTRPWTSTVRRGARRLSAYPIFAQQKGTPTTIFLRLGLVFGVYLWYSAGATIEVAVPFLVANDGQDRQYIAMGINGT